MTDEAPLAGEAAPERTPEASAASGAAPAPDAAGSVEPGRDASPAPPFVLPGARQVVGQGLQLAFESSAEIRRASLYVGLLFLLILGPLVVAIAVELPRLLTVPWGDLAGTPSRDLSLYVLEVVGPLLGLFWLAFFGFLAASVDGSLMAMALLGGHATGRPLRLREALQRARQSFWRFGAAAFVVGLISEAVSLAGLALADGFRTQPSIGLSLLLVFVGTILTAPFGYYAAGIVLGDVGGMTSLSRSVALARARPRLAAVVAAFTFAASALQTFGFGAAADVFERIGEALHPTFGPEGPPAALVVAVGSIAVVAFGSLAVTVSAIVSAPQVIAFLGLTHFAGGLDRARTPAPDNAAPDPVASDLAASQPTTPERATEAIVDSPPAAAPEPGAAPEAVAAPEAAAPSPRPPSAWDAPQAEDRKPARWITIPMLGLIGLSVLVAASVVVASVAPPPHPVASGGTLAEILQAHARGRSVTVVHPQPVGHPEPTASAKPTQGFPTIVGGDYARLDVVPTWILEELFDCANSNVACSSDGHPVDAFDEGAWLFAQTMVERPDALGPGVVAKAGPVLDLAQYDVAPATSRYPLANLAVTTTWQGLSRELQFEAYDEGSFQRYQTFARSALLGTTLLTLLPIKDELLTDVLGWDVYSSSSSISATVEDNLRGPDHRLRPIVGAPFVIFGEASPAPSR